MLIAILPGSLKRISSISHNLRQIYIGFIGNYTTKLNDRFTTENGIIFDINISING